VEVVGIGFYYEDMPVGRTFRTIRRSVTETDIVNFISATGMLEVLFTDMVFLEKESDIKGRVAPGALGYCFAEGLLAQTTMQHTGFAFLEMELKIERPLFAGDTIHVEVEVLETRLSRSRPGRGILRTRNRVINQNGETVLVYTPVRMIKCRPENRA
jgi:acyl dehydratase